MLGEDTLGYKVMLIIYRVCLEKSNAVIIQGVLGEGTLGYKVMLITYRPQGVLGEGTLVFWFGVDLSGHGDQDECAYVLSS